VTVLKPPRLKPNDVIGVIAPASAPSPPEKIDKGIRYLERLGYRVKLGKHAKNAHGYLAGRDPERLADLHAMFADHSVKAIFVVRGGYGTPRLLRNIDYDLIRRNPKILVGYSDITALQLAIFKKVNLITFSGPMVAVEMFQKMDPFTEEFFWEILTRNRPLGRVLNPNREPLRWLHVPEKKRTILGRLLGGNLSMIISLMGTRMLPDFSGGILLLEEIDEEPYRVDRMLTQLRIAGVLNRAAALLLGSFTNCVPTDKTKPSLTIEEVIHEVTAGLQLPILSHLAYGHISRRLTIPIGLKACIRVREGALEFLESPVT